MDIHRPGFRENNERQRDESDGHCRKFIGGKNNKEDIKKIVVEGFCDRFTSINHTPIRIIYMVRRLGLVGEKKVSKNILNRTWTPPNYIYKEIKDILLRIRKTQTLKALRYVKLEITRESFRSH